MFRRKENVIVEVTNFELQLMQESLLALRNQLLSMGRYTDPVDEMLVKLMANAK